MITLNAVNKAENRINKILTDKEAELLDINEQIEIANQKIKEAEKEMEEAINKRNLELYKKAKKKKSDVEDGKEMDTIRLNNLKEKALISESEYKKMVSDIYEEVRSIENQKKEKLAKLSDEMAKESRELLEVTKKANEVLIKLQDKIYRNEDRQKTGKGEIIFLTSEDKNINTYSTVKWGFAGVDNCQYEIYTGKKGR